MNEVRFFDRSQEFSITYKRLPHWAQAGAMCFITWRTADSLPAAVLERIANERARLLASYGLDSRSDWKSALAKLPVDQRGRAQWLLFEAWDQQLDVGAGAGLLKIPELSQIVADCLLHFDEQRYFVTDFVVMPNHVHVLVAFASAEMLATQCTSWKRYTARKIGAVTGRHGEFWQVEQFDHLVRSPEQFDHFRQYIADNPRRAALRSRTYRWYSRDLANDQA